MESGLQTLGILFQSCRGCRYKSDPPRTIVAHRASGWASRATRAARLLRSQRNEQCFGGNFVPVAYARRRRVEATSLAADRGERPTVAAVCGLGRFLRAANHVFDVYQALSVTHTRSEDDQRGCEEDGLVLVRITRRRSCTGPSPMTAQNLESASTRQFTTRPSSSSRCNSWPSRAPGFVANSTTLA